MGTAFVGGVFFRMAIKAALTTSSSTRAMVQAAIVLPARGLPAIMASTEMLLSRTSAPRFPTQNRNFGEKPAGHPINGRGASASYCYFRTDRRNMPEHIV